MGDGLEIPSRTYVGKDDLAQRAAIQGAVVGYHRITETLVDRSQSGRADCHDLSREPVGIDDDGAELQKPLRRCRFASADSASESNTQHVGSLLPAQSFTVPLAAADPGDSDFVIPS
jgi:hypothetical protein